MVHRSHPDYVLAIDHITEYYDIELATFGVDAEVKYSKPYLAINDDYYIKLHIQELRMCKQIRHTYYCEKLFLVKHKSKHSCKSATFYNLTSRVVYSVCGSDYYYNTTVTPSVLEGSSHILLANMLSPK